MIIWITGVSASGKDDDEDTSDVTDNDDDEKKMSVLDQANISQYTQAAINTQKSPIKPGKRSNRRKMKNKKTIATKSESSYL